MGLILSLNNSIHSFNTGKFVLDQYTGAAAAYSLRRLSVNSTNVVRVRRSVDNAEDNFTADEITDGTMTAWVNADMPLPLDTATAAAAYSLRNLKTSYTGSVIRVRRSSDNAEADFTADEITNGTLLAWVGNTASDNGHVTTWYDQAGSNDATQSTAASQPKIVDAGVLVEENGNPAVDFDGVDDYLVNTSGLTTSDNHMILSVHATIAVGGYLFSLGYNDIDSILLWTNNTHGSRYWLDGSAEKLESGEFSTNQRLTIGQQSSGTQSLYVDSSLNSSKSTTYVGDLVPDITIGYALQRNQNTNYYNGYIQECIYFNVDQSSNRTTIETNINDYYNIYAQDRDGFVTTWYDQAGSNDATQATAANQPKIVDAGVLVTENGKPAVDFNGNKSLTESSVSLTQPFSYFGVRKYNDDGLNREVFVQQNIASFNVLIDISFISSNANFGAYIDGDAETFNQTLRFVLANGVSSQVQDNAGTLYTDDGGTNGVSGLRIGYSPGTAFFESNLKGQEIIIYNSDQSSNRTGIETSINNHYNIYP